MSKYAPICLLMFMAAVAWICKAQAPMPVPKFAVEVPGPEGAPPMYVTLRAKAASTTFSDISRFWKPAGRPEPRKPAALKLDYRVQGDSVQITVSVFFDDYDRQDVPWSLDKRPAQKVCTYSAGLNESVTLAEMAAFGLQPLTLRIVSAQPGSSFRPETLSKAPSIQVEISGEDRTFYTVTLRNLSKKAVTGFSIRTRTATGGKKITSPNLGSRQMIAPAGSREIRIGRIPDQNFIQNSPPPVLALEAVFFEDGSYQGDPEVAAEIVALRVGAGAQRRRINPLIEAILADPRPDDDARVTRIRSEVGKLREEPDPEMVASVLSQFPGLPDQAVRVVKRDLALGLRDAKQSIVLDLRDFERNKENNHRLTLALWWSRRAQP